MRKYKFIGNKVEALYYKALAGNEPKKGKIYKGDSLDFTSGSNTVERWARDYPEEWKKIKKKQKYTIKGIEKLLNEIKKPIL